MRQEPELDFDSLCSVDLSPNTVLPSIPRHHSNVKKRSTIKKHKLEDFVLNVKDDFTEISFGGGRRRSRKSNSSSLAAVEENENKDLDFNVKDDFKEIRFGCIDSSHKSISPSLVELKDNEVLERRSKYQSYKDVGSIKGKEIRGERRKIEISHENYTSWVSGMVDSFCSSDEENPERKSPVLSFDTKLNHSSVNKACIRPHSSDSFIDIYLGSESSETVSKDSNNHLENVAGIGPRHNGKKLFKRDKVHALQKSLSAKVEMPKKQLPLESDQRVRHNPKVHVSSLRKMLDPFMKSKSVRSRFGHVIEGCGDKAVQKSDLQRNGTSRKSLLQDFSTTVKSSDRNSNFSNNDNHRNAAASSPVHLHGSLKLEKKHGMPFFEFSQSSPGDVYVAKTWKTGNTFNWVYTFHTQDHLKQSNASSFGLNRGKNSLMIGQMHVSCYLSSELKDGSLDNSMVTEFVLYDTARARQSTASQESCDSIQDVVKHPKSSNSSLVGEVFSVNDETPLEKPKLHPKHGSENCDNDSIDSSCPWDSEDLHPNLESASIVMRIPFSKRESLKHKRDDKTSGKLNSAIQNISKIEQRKDEPPQETLKVVIPIGNHGSPTIESRGPSTLLDRWRLGGGCDCGGWDMGCPLLILDTHSNQCVDNRAPNGKQTFELFHQGVKETTPALIMNVVKDGQYAVDFHARLSKLQAFSICVAILHATEACNAVQMDETKGLQQCNSLKVLLEEEVKFLVDTVTMDEKKRETGMLKEKPSSFSFNPLFSPIARV